MDDIIETAEVADTKLQTAEVSKPTIEEAHGKILRFGTKDLEDQEIKKKPEVPLLFTYKTETGQVNMIGVAHTSDVKSPMMQKITQEVGNYLNRTPKEKAIVMVEGFHGGPIPEWTSFDEAVNSSQEAGATAFMAREKGVEVISPEVPMEDVVAKLKEQGVPADRIALFYSLRAMPNLVRQGNLEALPRIIYRAQALAQAGWIPEFTADEEQRLKSDPEEAKRKGSEILRTAIPKLNGAMREINEQNVFNEETQEVLFSEADLHELTSPHSEKVETPLNQVARVDNEMRDDYLLDKIHEAVQNGKDPMVVYGGTHTVKINPALQHLYSTI